MFQRPSVRVVAAIIPQQGRCLLTRRPPGSHLAGYWEFPGGKIEAGENAAAALHRELLEELGVEVDAVELLWTIEHDYPEKRVELNFLAARIVTGIPQPLAASGIGWYHPREMRELPLLPADLVILERLEQFLLDEVSRG
jgi:mutator protein MutT